MAFKEIERLHHEVTDGGNPIGLDLKTRYVVNGIGKEQTISSKINIFYDKETGKITKVEDKWDGQLPDSSFQNVSVQQLFSLWWWVHYYEGWAWWMWSFIWETRVWRSRFHLMLSGMIANGCVSQVFRQLNSVTVPTMVSVPKNDEEDAKRGNQ